MQYYINYKIENLTIFGKLDSINKKYFVNEVEVINNRGIKNDIVFIENNCIIGMKERSNQNIIGILYFDSKINYGTYKDKELLLFKPTDYNFPNFYIPYKKLDNINKFVIINFKEWKITDKFPIGTLLEVIGKVGNKEVEFEYLRNLYNLRNNSWKIDNLKKKKDLNLLEEISSLKPDYEVFSIDPIGCTDIDDSFHYKLLVNNSYEIGIHIASPIPFFEENIEEILNRVSTIYTPNKKYNMLPNDYADNYCSLIENKIRYALSLILNIKDNQLIDYKIIKSIVKNIKNYTYDEYDKIKNNSYLNEFRNISSHFFNQKKIDSHQLVENWMIFANKIVANYLIEKNLNNIIIRKHEKNDDIIAENLDNNLIEYLNIRKEKSAMYELYNPDPLLNQTHSKLGKVYYTHFTSPIRRAVDLFIHLIIFQNQDIFEKEKLNNFIEKINIFTKNARKFSRMTKRLEFLYNIKEEEIITYGFIIDIVINKIIVYIPDYNLEEKIIIIPKKFEILENYKEKIDKYKLYQKLNIKLWVFSTFDNIFDKLKIEILDD